MSAFAGSFNNWSLRLKAALITLILVAALAAIGVEAYVAISLSNAGLHELAGDLIAKRAKTRAWTVSAANVHTDLFRLVAWTSNGVNAGTVAALSRRLLDESVRFLDRIGELDDPASDPAVARLETEIAGRWRRYQEAVGDVVEIAPSDPALATIMLGGADEEYRTAVAAISDLLSFYSERADAETAKILKTSAAASRALAVTEAIASVAFTLALLMLVRSVVLPIQQITEALDGEAAGPGPISQLSAGRRDEIGRMLDALQRFAREIASKELALQREGELLDSALQHMSHGLMMVDAHGVVIVCNQAYRAIYRLGEADAAPGTPFRDLIACKVERGVQSAPEAEDYLRRSGEQFEATGASDVTIALSDGRLIKISRRGMAAGGWVSTHEDVTERRQTEERILHLARHDPLTGLSNRFGLRERATGLLAQSDPLAVLFLDLDRFKVVNDSYGHPVGDELLAMVAQRLLRSVRDADIVARLGGDEFAVVISGQCSRRAMEELAQRLVAEVAAPYVVGNIPISIGVSIGVVLSPEHGSDFDRLLQCADMALYQAKDNGRNGFCWFERAIDAAAERRRRLELALPAALASDECELLYQPIVAARDGALVCCEALMRWRHKGEDIPPSEFIPIAEQIGCVGHLGAWALHEACRTAAMWPEAISVSVNVSALQFRQGELVSSVRSALAASGLAADRLQLEITESVLISDPDAVIAVLDELRAMRVKVAMDDFGTGYSSLSYLRRFDFDKVKIDRSFVVEVDTRTEAAAITHLIASLGPILGAVICAEGVETRAQAAKLTELGCAELQGFLFAKPLSAEALAEYLRRRQNLSVNAA